MATPKAYIPAARFAARKTKPRPSYRAATLRPRAEPEQIALQGYEWPFPETIVRGRIVRNIYDPWLATAARLIPAAIGLFSLFL